MSKARKKAVAAKAADTAEKTTDTALNDDNIKEEQQNGGKDKF
ncbi:hypothetical protein [Qingrenia yutianensis]|nr:hypothetical protein [Qingrenia yutianensis]